MDLPIQRNQPFALHPVIGLALLFVLAGALAVLPLAAISVVFAGLLAEHATRGALAQLRAGLWRLKWLFLAILLLYWGFTPGEPMFEFLAKPSQVGAVEGAKRALILATMIAGVYTLVRPLPPALTAAALVWWLRPIALLGVPTATLARRIAATLDALAHVERLARQARADSGRWIDRAAALFLSVEHAAFSAADQHPQGQQLPQLDAVPPVQWFGLLACTTCVIVIAVIPNF